MVESVFCETDNICDVYGNFITVYGDIFLSIIRHKCLNTM